MKADNPTRVFVYGTLRRGCSNFSQMAGAQFIDLARTAPGYTLYRITDYPGMVRTADSTERVSGELWELDPTCLERIDQFEGTHEGLFHRESVELIAPHDNLPAYAYYYGRSIQGLQKIGSLWEET